MRVERYLIMFVVLMVSVGVQGNHDSIKVNFES